MNREQLQAEIARREGQIQRLNAEPDFLSRLLAAQADEARRRLIRQLDELNRAAN